MRILFLAILLMAGPALSQTLDARADCTGGVGVCVTIDETESTDLLVTMKRGSFHSIVFDPDDGSTGTATTTIIIWGMCVVTPTSSNHTFVCEKLIVDVDGDGTLDDLPLNGDSGAATGTQRRAFYNVAGQKLWIDIVAAPGAGEDALISFEEN